MDELITRNRTRSFFHALCWNYDGEIKCPVFVMQELVNLPLKWLKYLLLERVGLITEEELDKMVKRFCSADFTAIKKDCEQMLRQALIENKKIMIVIKAVFFNKAGQLPNYRIYSLDEVPAAVGFISKYVNNAKEIWLCQSSVDDGGSNFGGRISFAKNGEPLANYIEIVWFTSPRKIEDLCEHFSFPFLRAYKKVGTLRYIIDRLYVPKKYVQHGLKERLLADFQWALVQLYHLREPIERLQDILYGAGVCEVCLEFKASFGRLTIIDWDTEIETAPSSPVG